MTEITNICSACAAGLFAECENPEHVLYDELTGIEYIVPCAHAFESTIITASPAQRGLVGRPPSDPSEIKDPTSTGRKRAKMLAPIFTGQRCAWAGLKHAGGGVVPILGCDNHEMIEKKGGEDGLYQGDRHHGPNKNTLDNTPGLNLHSICVDCHHRWHALNDPYYGDKGRGAADEPYLPVEAYYLHDAVTTFTDEEHAAAELWWAMSPFERPPYPFQPPATATKALPLSSASATLDPNENPFVEEGDA